MSSCAPKLGVRVTEFVRPKRRVTRVFIHCSATSNKSISANDINRWHTQDNGWSCIGYHFFIESNGTLVYGRDLERTPAAQSGHNTDTIAICLNGLVDTDFSQAQYDALRQLCQAIASTIPGVTFHGHCEVAAKSCPVFDYRSVLGLDAQGRMGAQSSPPQPAETWELRISRTAVGEKAQPRHPHVALAQGLLHAHGHDCGRVDGIAGPKFDAALKAFQSANGLAADGVAGEQTWELLEEGGK